MHNSKIIAIMGTNASGKSEFAIHLANKFNGEIVSADSRQVYKGLDIGTGKVTTEQMKSIPHHLINVVNIEDFFSLAQYQKLAYETLDDILSRNKIPFLVGGTGLYLRAVIEGYKLVKVPPNHQLRKKLAKVSIKNLVQILKNIDNQIPSLIDLKNKQRIIRAIEIQKAGHSYESTRQHHPRYQVLQLGISWPREILYERIDKRLSKRLKEGMVEEVKKLLAQKISEEILDELGLEYRYILRFLKGYYSTEKEFFDALRFAIHSFARKQICWFKKNKEIKWLNTQNNYYREAEQKIKEFLK